MAQGVLKFKDQASGEQEVMSVEAFAEFPQQ
jgi:hypothetical protein